MGYKPLDEESVNFIIDNYYKLNYNEMSEKLNISKSRVFAQCSELRKQGILKEKKKIRVKTMKHLNKYIL